MSIEINKKKELQQLEQAANLSTYTTEPSRRSNFHYDDYDESTIPLNEIDSQIPLYIVITTSPPILPIEDLEDSLIIGNKELSTIPEKESDEVIKSSVEDFGSIPSESEDISESDSECDLPSCDDFSPINVLEGKLIVLIIDWLSIDETDKMIHIMDTDIVKLMVEIESFSMSSDKFDEEAGSSDGLQPKKVDLSYVVRGRLSALERIALSARVVIEKF
nr:hypothetical protein [Tanacetum cinerariifolium]